MSAHPAQASLDVLFARATGARILDHHFDDDGEMRPNVMAEVSGAEIGALHAMLRIREDGPSFHCMCIGDLTVELLSNGEPFTSLSFHHARSVRHADWDSDAILVDGPALVRWLAMRGVPGPLRTYEEGEERARQDVNQRLVWLAAAPPCFAPDLPRFESDAYGFPLDPDSSQYDEAEQRLRAAYPTPEAACAALLSWFGTGAGPWSGFPSYEALPEDLLHRLGLPLASVVASSTDASEAVLRGAARLFASWEVVSRHKSMLGDIPEAVWPRLRAVVQSQNNADNQKRFHAAETIAEEVRTLRAPSSL